MGSFCVQPQKSLRQHWLYFELLFHPTTGCVQLLYNSDSSNLSMISRPRLVHRFTNQSKSLSKNSQFSISNDHTLLYCNTYSRVVSLYSFLGRFGFLVFLDFFLSLDDVERFDDIGNNLVSHESLMDRVDTSRSTYFGLLPDPDPNPDQDAISEPSLSYAAVRNKNPLPTFVSVVA